MEWTGAEKVWLLGSKVRGHSTEVRVAKSSHLCMAPLEGWSGWCSALSEVVSSSSLLREALSLPDSLKNGAGERERERERERGGRDRGKRE